MAGTAYLEYSNRLVTHRTGGRYDYTERWIVPEIENTGGGNDTASDTWQNEALGATGLPALGDQTSGGYVCTSLTPRSLASQGYAVVDARWQEDPLTLPTEVHYFAGTKTKPAWKGIPTAPGEIGIPDNDIYFWSADYVHDVRNSAGDRYNPPVTYEAPLERIEVTLHCSIGRHEAIDWSRYLKHWNRTEYAIRQVDPDQSNNTTFRVFPAGSLFLADKRAPLVKEPYFHRLLTCVFLYDPDLWGTRVPDMGPRCLKHLAPDGSGGVTLKPWTTDESGLGTVTDALGWPYSGPAELDGEGSQLVPRADGSMPPAVIYAWWPVDDSERPLWADFEALALYTPERTLAV